MNVRPGTAADMATIARMLEQAGLPTSDLATSRVEFTVLTEADEIVGIGGMERFGVVALLRSVVVDTDRRSQGVGAVLLSQIERQAFERGARELVLLTQTAEGFFARHGYAKIPRASVAESIKNTAEFRTLCPDSAVCMTKRL